MAAPPSAKKALMIVRKVASLFAVAGLVLLSVLAGSTAAYAAVPTPPSVDQTFAPWITSAPERTVQGNKDSDVTQIDVYHWTDSAPTPVPYCSTAAVDGATVWFNCAPGAATLGVGTNYLAATATNLDGTSALGVPIVITRVAAPTISTPADGVLTSDNTPSLSGTADPATTHITVYSDGPSNFCSNVPVVAGAWSCTVGAALPDGDYSYFLDGSPGDTVRSASQTITIDTALTPPLAHITAPADSTDPGGAHFASTTDPTPALSGTAEPLATITLFQDYTEVGCVGGAPQADVAGNWSCTLATPLTAQRTYVYGAQHTDRAGNTNVGSSPDEQLYLSYIDIDTPDAPVITSPIDYTNPDSVSAVINYAPPTITGTGEPGAHLGAYVDGSIDVCSVPVVVDLSGVWSCTLPSLSDGVYQITFTLTDDAGHVSASSDRFLALIIDTTAPTGFSLTEPAGVPDDSNVVHATTTAPHPVIAGFAETGARVYLYLAGQPVGCDEGQLISGASGFTCHLTEALSPGVYDFSYTQTDQAGNSSGAPAQILRLTVASAAPPPAAPAAPGTTTIPQDLPTFVLFWALEFKVDSDTVTPGQHVTITSQDLPPGASVEVELHSTPALLGTTTVLEDGTFSLEGVIPLDVEPGAHHYVVTVVPVTGEAQTVELPVTVSAPPPAAEVPNPSPSPRADAGASGSGSAGVPTAQERDLPAAPNSLSGALTSLHDVISNPLILGAAALSSLALLFLVAFPAELLNSTLDANYERVFGRVPRIRMPWLTRMRKRLGRAPVVGALGLTALVSLILSFSDPEFGFDLTSLRLFLAVAIGMFVLGWFANIITGLLLRRRWNIGSVIELQPFGVFVALVGVVLSRVLDFSPGLLIGLVLGLALSSSASAKDEARYVLVWAGALLGLSLLAWVTYSLTTGLVPPDTFGGALFDDTLVAIATEGISALAVGLLPLGFLDGRSLFHYSKLQWVGAYLLTLIAFFVIMVPSGALWGDVAESVWGWLAVLVGFAAVSIGVSVWFRTHPGSEPDEAADSEDADARESAVAVGDGRVKKH